MDIVIIHERITKHQKRTWKEFLSWMLNQGMCTEIDFKAEEWRWKLSKDNQWLKIEEEGEAKWCQNHENNHECFRKKENQTP